jgi:hypothetical protein
VIIVLGGAAPGWFALLVGGVAVTGGAAMIRALFLTGIEIQGERIIVRTMLRTARIANSDIKAVRTNLTTKPWGYVFGRGETSVLEVVLRKGGTIYCTATFGRSEIMQLMASEVCARVK